MRILYARRLIDDASHDAACNAEHAASYAIGHAGISDAEHAATNAALWRHALWHARRISASNVESYESLYALPYDAGQSIRRSQRLRIPTVTIRNADATGP